MHIPAPKMPLPGHVESYRPPKEYLFTEEEQKQWEVRVCVSVFVSLSLPVSISVCLYLCLSLNNVSFTLILHLEGFSTGV